MRNNKMNYIAIGCFFALLLCACLAVIEIAADSEVQDLTFKAKTNKETLILGEPVEIEFVFFNTGNNSVIIPSSGVEAGSLQVFIAKPNEEFKEYFASGWGRKRGTQKALEPKQSYSYKSTILWNGKPNVSHLNEDSAKRVLKGKITTEYALPEPGTYLIKGISYVGENAVPIESDPIEIVVNAPVGDDLKVWNQIKGNREIALLMQTSEFNTSKDEEKEKLVRDVEQIIVQYPNSVYSSYLRTNLEKYKASEEKRNEFMRKLKQP
jgi:hypothetical protein